MICTDCNGRTAQTPFWYAFEPVCDACEEERMEVVGRTEFDQARKAMGLMKNITPLIQLAFLFFMVWLLGFGFGHLLMAILFAVGA